jgi:tRNA (guanine-N7-)-methyltransferase
MSVPTDAPAGPIDWSREFPNTNPVEVEVGFGKGAFLLDAALAHPQTNYLGIEIDRGLQLYTATRLAKRSLTNAKVACADARRFFAERVPPGSVAAVHVYFPDPWWKARHKKRRVFTADFAAAVEQALAPGGRLLIATDVEEYFDLMTALASERPTFYQVGRRLETGPAGADELVTNFERKARAKGTPVWRAEIQKRVS